MMPAEQSCHERVQLGEVSRVSAASGCGKAFSSALSGKSWKNMTAVKCRETCSSIPNILDCRGSTAGQRPKLTAETAVVVAEPAG